ncbi:MAG: hypothetical protein ACR2NA_05730 [Solirubrobacterales bacterium]
MIDAVTSAIAADAVRRGRVRGRYFRENFAQGGIDLVQIIPELVTNADAAIAGSGRVHGRLELWFGAPEPELVRRWAAGARMLGVPALRRWQAEVRCADDGVGVNAAVVDQRLGALGTLPESPSQRGLFGRGLRDVWLAQGGGRIQGVRDGRAVESWFFPSAGDDPYLYAHVIDAPAATGEHRSLGLKRGTRVAVPLADARLPPPGRIRTLVCDLVQIRPVLEDPAREVWLETPGQTPSLVVYCPPEPDPDRPLLYEDTIRLADGVEASVTVRRAAHPIPLNPARALRRGGLVVRSGRAAHEATMVGYESRAGARRIYGEVRCEALEALQREALESARPQVVVKVDRSGLNDVHPVVKELYSALEKILGPLVDEEERRAGANHVRAGKQLQALDRVGLRALNDVLRAAFDSPGTAGDQPGLHPAGERSGPSHPTERQRRLDGGAPETGADLLDGAAIAFRRSPLRLHPGETRGVSLVFDPAQIPPESPVTVAADAGIGVWLPDGGVPEAQKRGYSRLSGTVRARVSVDPGSRLTVLAEAAGHTAELEVLIVRHRSSGWVREIARKEIDSQVEAEFHPESGVVTVYEGRREFRALERAARRAGLSKRRVREYLPYRMLEVEAAANAVYIWAAERVIERRFADGHPSDAAEYAAGIRLEAQALRHRAHEKLMRAFLEPEVFEGGVRVRATQQDAAGVTATLL